ncbi:flagellar motor switch phosphatase FliY [Cytobacillus gottheilii]|uniref:Flagellar motor switch phosphatase FliY n=1 Tax=Cytobacillus gottheilii TaxID=859144 RepID=A0ABX8FH05_9BACI|nr:flagellar motor switch phosphatase FliY [Cytobacillus gottheilii]QVY63300.1 flagellar motor switch phosphatase FliY [Cytobacillus gottheilii]
MMSDGMLSQDEIDALLRGTDGDQPSEKEAAELNIDELISPMEQDALGEIGNISFGSSATALSALLNQKVDITTPTVSVILKKRLIEEFPHPYVAIQVSYTEGFLGSNLLVINQEDAAVIADLMLGGDGKNPSDLLDEIRLSAVQEAMNQMMGSAATSMSTIFGKKVDISPPTIDLLNLPDGEGMETIPPDDKLIKISFRLKIGDLIDSNIMQLLPLSFGTKLVHELMNPGSETDSASSPEQPAAVELNKQQETVHESQHTAQYTMQPEQQPVPQAQPMPQHQAPPQAQQMQQQSYQAPPQHIGTSFQGSIQPNVQPAVFSEFDPYQNQPAETKNLNMLLDIPLQITVELGRTKRSVKEILELSAGSIIELDKLAGEPVDILVNNRLIAQGEVVVIDENFGVRVTDIISQTDRIKKLK